MAAPCRKMISTIIPSKWSLFHPIRGYSLRPPPSFGLPLHLPRRVKALTEEPRLEPSFDERLAEIKEKESVEATRVNIGSEHSISSSIKEEYRVLWRHRRGNQELERAARNRTLEVPLDDVKATWSEELGPNQVQIMAEHYGIFRDLFNNAYFTPVVDMDISYNIDEEHVMPVYRGNKISPTDAKDEPNVSFEVSDDSLWTLLMTNPDGHLTDNNAEYLHWLIGNIPGGDVSKGDVLSPYLQPFPPKGTGFHRLVFVLFKQSRVIDYSNLRQEIDSIDLDARTFDTVEFLADHLEELTPMGLAFFQSQHDSSVRDIYHHQLDMREPMFEYDHPAPYLAPLKTYPHKEPFDRYYDRYRDKKDLAEEVLRLKLSMISPFSEYKRPKYPLIHMERDKPSWLVKKEELMHRRVEQYKDLPE